MNERADGHESTEEIERLLAWVAGIWPSLEAQLRAAISRVLQENRDR
jgi:hypothetical protein